jgi:3',5'-cyclic AMP phosphodiesterase CpdA
MRLAHISDLHIGLSAEDTSKGQTSRAVAKAIAEDLAEVAEALDVVVVSGDLTEHADPAAFLDFERLFGAIGLPIVVVPGNHDGPSGMHGYSRSSDTFSAWNITNRVEEFAGVRFLGLDTCLEGMTEGKLDEEGLARLADEIAKDLPSRLVIVMHHPPLVLGLERFDSFCRLESRERLMDILGRANLPITILSGHVHRPYVATEGNVACHVAGSLVAPYDSRLPFGNHPIRPAALQDFYYIHDFGRGGYHVVTPQRVLGLAP